MKTKIIPAFLVPLLLAAGARALEVPIERAAKGKKGVVVAFVDMDRIYRDFPETQKARKEYQDHAAKLKEALADKEAEMSDLREQLSVLTAASESVLGSTASVADPGAAAAGDIAGGLSEKKRALAEQEDALLQAKKEAARTLDDFERTRAQQIFGKLYKSLVQLADEKGVDLVVDKQSLLYGQAALDLTEPLSRRVRGLPDEDVK